MIYEPSWKFLNSQQLDLDTAWWQIYESSFPSSERDAKEHILHAVEKNIAIAGSYQLQKNTMCIVVFYCLQAPGLSFVFLNYIAIDNSKRNQGLGGKLFLDLLLHVKKMNASTASPYQVMVWEVEDVDTAPNLTEKQLRERRLNFYQRLGGQYFKHMFIQPPIDGFTLLSMRLMYCLLYPIDILDFESRIIEAIYFQKYHMVNRIDKKILNNLLHQIINE